MQRAVSESARARELHRHLQPWLQLFSDSTLPSNETVSRASKDKALTAFAQLGALRLNVKRGMISFLDTDKQYILCEATQSVSLQDDSRHDPGDHIWLGSSVLDRDFNFGDSVLKDTYTVQDYTADGFVCADLPQHTSFCHRPYVQNGDVIWYAGVPLTTSKGISIGAYSLCSDRARPPPTYDEIMFMQDIAATIIAHFERIISQNERLRGERMVQGLAKFIEGKHSVGSDATIKPNDIPTGTERNDFRSTLPTVESQSEQNRRADTKSLSSQQESGSQRTTVTNLPRTVSQGTVLLGLQNDAEKLLIRAAQMIRESMNADGVLFYDASVGSVGDSPPKIAKDLKHEYQPLSSDDLSISEEEQKDPEKPQLDDSQTADSSTNDQPDTEETAKIVGYSITDNVPAGQGLGSLESFKLSVKTLNRCISKYPRGKVFTRGADEIFSSGEENASERSTFSNESSKTINTLVPGGKSQSRTNPVTKSRFVANQLNRMLPFAKTIIWLPVWDYRSERWFAGGVIWINDFKTLINAEYDLLYIKAFGNSIINEMTRMDAEKVDRSKTTFIASISHELRSPLHGILGSTEFLKDTSTDSFQAGLIHSIDTCSRTLLDTIDSVLDFSKINNLRDTRSIHKNRGSKSAVRRRPTAPAVQEMGLTEDFDFAVLVEEVFEALFAGQTFRDARKNNQHESISTRVSNVVKKYRNGQKHSSPDKAIAKSAERFGGSVIAVLNISKISNWGVRSQSGALRRIVMNLLGNALKYTEDGTVELTLKSTSDANLGKTKINLKIKDTGKGISAEFLRDHLFMPFSQQDSFAAGTGLGLSIVRQLVDSLGGKVELTSEEGVGTEAVVSFSLPTSKQQALPSDASSRFQALASRHLKVCLLDPNESNHQDRCPESTASLIETCRSWLGIEVFRSHDKNDVDADFWMYAEPPPVEYLLSQFGADAAPSKRDVPLIIVTSNTLEASAFKVAGVDQLHQSGRIVDVISHPLGPQKLAQTFAHYTSDNPETKNINPLPTPTPSIKPRPTTFPTLSHDKYDHFRPKMQQRTTTGAVSFPITKTESYSVLIVDDNDINLRLLSTFMRRSHIYYKEAKNGLEALETYQNAAALVDTFLTESPQAGGDPKFDKPIADDSSTSIRLFNFVIMDISMPIMDGLTATREIRATERSLKLKPAIIIALTGLGSDKIQQEARESGVDHFLTKPVKFQDLRSMLDLFIESL